MRRTLYLLLSILFISGLLPAQQPIRYSSADIHAAIAKLQVVGSALYVAAHPDDENTSMIAWLSNQRKVRTAYLSLTRGDGGQNLIGPEIAELLGVIRTQELLAARRIDGGEQMFSRANDFGYSKHPDETLAIWNEEEVLADAVWAIRKFRPDIIINRFDHESAGRTHGHHTSSAIISYRAFQLAGDPTAYPEQLKFVEPWQPTRLYFNTSWWFYGSREAFAEADKSNMVVLDDGVYYPWIGKSNSEIAAESRSMHRCQGMGRSLSRGSDLEYLLFLQGEKPTDQEDPFSGIPTSWDRLKGGAPIGKLLAEIEADFNYFQPHLSVPKLLEARKLIAGLSDDHWRKIKLEEIDEIIYGCLGLYLEATASEASANPGASVTINLEALNRSPVFVSLQNVVLQPVNRSVTTATVLSNNEPFLLEESISIPADHSYTSPYWLNEPGTLGMYRVDEQQLRGLPETPRDLVVEFHLTIEGESITYRKEIVFKDSDPVEGEIYQPFEVLPKAFVAISDPVYVFGDDSPKPVEVTVRAGSEEVSGNLRLNLPAGWQTEPESFPVQLDRKGAEESFVFNLIPPTDAAEGDLLAVLETAEGSYTKELIQIDYEHIPLQSVLLPAKSRAVRIDLKKAGNRIAYIMGAGDDIPAGLEQVGYEVDILDPAEVNTETLAGYDALILGVRAYNTVERIEFLQPLFMEYVKQGGTMMVQFNTAHRLRVPSEEIGPYPITLSRERVSVEEAPIRMLAPEHPALNYPNKITEADFDGWVQERGLYFPNEWDEHYTPILSSNDPGEPARDGGLLIAPYGQGYFIYTGYSWFRQLPAGVPGAYRLFTNLISIGQKEKP